MFAEAAGCCYCLGAFRMGVVVTGRFQALCS